MGELKPFSKILVANRGEVAVRLIRACHELGIASVAVFSDADREALHVRMADEAVHLGGSPAAESYLDSERLLQAAARAGADAVHPGFGFLAESASFAEACVANGLVFIGPPPEAMRLMASKAAARQQAAQLGVPVIPGGTDVEQRPAGLRKIAADIGYPVMIKALAGGGGVGMRVVTSEGDFDAALESVQHEARAAFGDARVLVEKYLPQVRHIEVQVLADRYGHSIHCFERECSLQRRRQKVVEEAPSFGLGESLREEMARAALKIARSVDYEGLGTVEFIVPADSESFYFLEMNTRLQVEHGVTEAITGIDLVHQQIRMAEGRPLDIRQDDIAMRGHAVECRVYAEDPQTDFAPSSGSILCWRPGEVQGLRVDSGILDGVEVSQWYDPMLAKLIVHADDRPAAIRLMQRALETTCLLGIHSNLGFLASVMRHPDYRTDRVSTSFIDQQLEQLRRAPVRAQRELLAIMAAVHRASGRRVGETAARPRVLELTPAPAGFALRMRVRAVGPGHFECAWEGNGVDVRLGQTDEMGRTEIEIDGHSHRFTARETPAGIWIHSPTTGNCFVEIPSRFSFASAGPGSGGYHAAMPGRVIDVLVEQGALVSAGDTLLLIESMKMEHRVLAASCGRVSFVGVRPGDAIEKNARLVEVASTEVEGVVE